MEKITKDAARRLMLAVQSLDKPAPQPAAKADVIEMIRRMGYLQIDTIHVVARSPYLVLWSRLGDYRPEWLEELLAEGALFEYWAHAMCFVPIEDYPLYRRWMLDAMHAKSWPVGWAVDWVRENPEKIEVVHSRMRENGPVRSAEFENKNRPPGGWWNWKDEKNSLEALFLTGEVMIARRQNFQRVYDLRERVLPGWDDAKVPTAEEVQRTLILRAVKVLGAAFPAWISDYFRMDKKTPLRIADELAAEGKLIPLTVEGLDGTAYLHPENLDLAGEIVGRREIPAFTTFLSPFDPLVSDRKRLSQLFDFDYTIECYTPAAKRCYGYFTMPILHNGRLVGRIDPKAHRTRKVFEVKTLHLEPGVEITPELIADLAAALKRLAAWHATPEVIISASNPPELAGLVESAL
jgi:uncharacterized protein YcaQ